MTEKTLKELRLELVQALDNPEELVKKSMAYLVASTEAVESLEKEILTCRREISTLYNLFTDVDAKVAQASSLKHR